MSDHEEDVAFGESLPNPRIMNPYQRLVWETARTQDISYGEVARRAGRNPATGKPRLSRQRIQQIVEKPITRSPSKETITGLARGLGISENTIRTAIAETLGLRVLYEAPSADITEIVGMVEKLPAPDQERWVRLARLLVREFQQYPAGPRRSGQAGFTVDREKADGMEMFLAKIEGTPDLSDDQRSELIEFGKKIMDAAAG